jgi:hypothetical protein
MCFSFVLVSFNCLTRFLSSFYSLPPFQLKEFADKHKAPSTDTSNQVASSSTPTTTTVRFFLFPFCQPIARAHLFIPGHDHPDAKLPSQHRLQELCHPPPPQRNTCRDRHIPNQSNTGDSKYERWHLATGQPSNANGRRGRWKNCRYEPVPVGQSTHSANLRLIGSPAQMTRGSEEMLNLDDSRAPRRKNSAGDQSMRRSIQDLVSSIDPSVKIEPDVEDVSSSLGPTTD